MGDLVQRPRFFEGQTLGAADLAAGLEYARSQSARHGRLVHEWGIADGLALAATPQAPASGSAVRVTLSPGLAIDGTGREVVVPDPVVLDEKLFTRSNVAVADPEALYPVLLAGADSPALPPPVSHRCTVATATRTVESYKLVFGAPGDEIGLDRQPVPRVDQGAGGAPDQKRWWILLGFVRWDAAQRRFTGVAERSNGVGRRYVGVRADRVTAQGGTLTLRSRPAGTAGAPMVTLESTSLGGTLSLGVDDGHGGMVPRVVANTDGTIESGGGSSFSLRSGPSRVPGKPTLRLDETPGGGTLTFGLQEAGGHPSRLLAVDERGNLAIAGVFTGLAEGAVKVVSGIAADGVSLPLPEGITEEQVATEAVSLHVQLAPHPPGPAPAGADLASFPIWIGTPISAAVDASRRLDCRVQWVGWPQGGGPPSAEVRGGTCQYLVLAVVKGPRAVT
jgi:hypothetical protein